MGDEPGPLGSDYFGQPGVCHYCGKEAWTKDHVVPRALIPRGFKLAVPNLVPACGPCNHSKGNRRSECRCYGCGRAWDAYRERRLVAVAPPAHRRAGRKTSEMSWCFHCETYHTLDVFTNRKPGCRWRWQPG